MRRGAHFADGFLFDELMRVTGEKMNSSVLGFKMRRTTRVRFKLPPASNGRKVASHGGKPKLPRLAKALQVTQIQPVCDALQCDVCVFFCSHSFNILTR